MIYLEDASRKQLLTIALHENCDIDLKFAACRELQIRQWRDEYLTEIVILWGRGLKIVEIAAEVGLPEYTIKNVLKLNGLYGKRVTA